MREIYTYKKSAEMRQRIKELFDNPSYSTDEKKLALACNQVFMELYPELKVRWARIYGPRWAYLCGGSEEISIAFKKIRLNDRYGICIDNAHILSPGELEEIIDSLKECFV
ncbi:MAG: hypothetical protein H5T98_04115 [Syntrophomonadaceae bacterium]|nr:hypothetical protein [Syntrophomonadaceae bacterium]